MIFKKIGRLEGDNMSLKNLEREGETKDNGSMKAKITEVRS